MNTKKSIRGGYVAPSMEVESFAAERGFLDSVNGVEALKTSYSFSWDEEE